MGERVLVSVVMITYGHEKYIRQAIEGVLMQEGDFDLELVIANDCSPDNTDAVVQDVLSHHSNAHWIRYVRHEKNIGMMPNFIFALQQAKGKYVALCDGDDYWTDPFKLQKQVAFLEANSDYVIHSSGAKLIKDDILTEESIGFGKESKAFEITDFYRNNNLVSCTIMFRNVLHEFPGFYKKLAFGDWFLYILLMHKTGGKSYRLNENLSAYRIHNTSAMASLTNETFFSKHFALVIAIKKYLKLKSDNTEIINGINFYALQYFSLIVRKNIYKAIKIWLENFLHCGIKTPFKQYLVIIFK